MLYFLYPSVFMFLSLVILAIRNSTLDLFKGVSVLLMILFTLGNFLSPGSKLFSHNIFGYIYPGDFILGLFVFASGASTIYFNTNREKEKRLTIYLDLFERFLKLFLVSFLATPLISGTYALDEVLINAIVFSVVFITIDLFSIFSLYLLIFILIILYFALLPDLYSFFGPQFYLGGYPSIIFYLICGAFGALFSHCFSFDLSSKIRYFFFLFSLSIISLFFIPMKLISSPSYMILSALFATILYLFLNLFFLPFKNNFILKNLIYLGSKSLRVWLMMIFLFLLPALIYTNFVSRVYFDEFSSSLISLFFLLIVFYISLLIDDLNVGFVKRWKL